MNDNKNQSSKPHHPLPFSIRNQDPNKKPKLSKRFIFIISLIAISLSLSLCARGQQPKLATLQLTYDGLNIIQKNQEELTSISFGISVDQVRQILGPEDLMDEDLYIYARLGLSLYFDQDALRIIATFNNQSLNPALIGSIWQVDTIRIDAGAFGTAYSKAIKQLKPMATWSEIKEDHSSFGLKGNTLELFADNRDRVVVVVYRYQNFTLT